MLSTGVSFANSLISTSCERSMANLSAIASSLLRMLVASFSASRLI